MELVSFDVHILAVPRPRAVQPPVGGSIVRGAAKSNAVRPIAELEPTLTAQQASLLHQVRLAAESLGPARDALLLPRPG